MNGFLLIDKPSGISSRGCLDLVKKILNEKKVGHCGTLDPLATGILPISIGEATKFSHYVSSQPKTYNVKILFGLETDTGDITGMEIYKADIKFSKKELAKTLKSFIGKQDQIPPMYSALKRDGKPLYYWARKGVSLKREPRQIEVQDLNLKPVTKMKEIEIEISCTKGTYIRALVQAIGKSLNSAATVLELRRTHIGSFNEDNLVKIDNSDKDLFLKSIIGSSEALKDFPKIVLNKEETKKIINGLQVDYNARQEKEGIVRLYEEEGSFIGIGSVDSSMKLSPKRLINTQKYSASPSKI